MEEIRQCNPHISFTKTHVWITAKKKDKFSRDENAYAASRLWFYTLLLAKELKYVNEDPEKLSAFILFEMYKEEANPTLVQADLARIIEEIIWRLIRGNLELINGIAMGMWKKLPEQAQEDFYLDAVEGMFKGMSKYNQLRAFKAGAAVTTSAYMWCLSVVQTKAMNRYMPYINRGYSYDIWRFRAARIHWKQRNKEPFKPEYVLKELHISDKKWKWIEPYVDLVDISLEEYIPGTDQMQLQDIIADPDTETAVALADYLIDGGTLDV